MGFMDMLTGKDAQKDVFGDDVEAPAAAQPAADPSSSVQDLYGLGPAAPAAPAQPPAAPAPAPQPAAQAAAPAPAAPAPAAPAPAAPAPAAPAPAAPAPSSGGDSGDPLDLGLRELFTETAAVDPQLEALLGRVERVSAGELASELKEFAKSIGVPASEQTA